MIDDMDSADENILMHQNQQIREKVPRSTFSTAHEKAKTSASSLSQKIFVEIQALLHATSKKIFKTVLFLENSLYKIKYRHIKAKTRAGSMHTTLAYCFFGETGQKNTPRLYCPNNCHMAYRNQYTMQQKKIL